MKGWTFTHSLSGRLLSFSSAGWLKVEAEQENQQPDSLKCSVTMNVPYKLRRRDSRKVYLFIQMLFAKVCFFSFEWNIYGISSVATFKISHYTARLPDVWSVHVLCWIAAFFLRVLNSAANLMSLMTLHQCRQNQPPSWTWNIPQRFFFTSRAFLLI